MHKHKEDILKQIKGGLIVSCQALEYEPLHSPYIMSRMAYAAQRGGASGIRANSIEDIKAIKKLITLPIIGIIKHDYPDSEVRITATLNEIEQLVAAGVEIIATDATNRLRPHGITLESFFKKVRSKYKDQLFMADCSTLEEGLKAEELGFDLVGTTLCGYTSYTQDQPLPNYKLMKALVSSLKVPVIAEGGIWSPEDLKEAMNCKVFTAVVGSAITRPMDITQKYVSAIKN
ncbi:MAG: nanE [Clostridia bacterium]|jgi:N-acylglucosamine-6-phosphate 2-epimerase|nr:nanE [Clostridia bacterium]